MFIIQVVESKVLSENFKIKLFPFESQVISLKKMRESCFVGRYLFFCKGKILENIETLTYSLKLVCYSILEEVVQFLKTNINITMQRPCKR